MQQERKKKCCRSTPEDPAVPRVVFPASANSSISHQKSPSSRHHTAVAFASLERIRSTVVQSSYRPCTSDSAAIAARMRPSPEALSGHAASNIHSPPLEYTSSDSKLGLELRPAKNPAQSLAPTSTIYRLPSLLRLSQCKTHRY